MDNSLEEMHRNHVVLWDWLAKTGDKKKNAPIWEKNGGYIDSLQIRDKCFCCQWVEDNNLECEDCPIDLDCGGLRREVLYSKWADAVPYSEEKKRLAAEIRDMPLVNKKMITYRIGQRFVGKDDKYYEEIYILAASEATKVLLISLESGNRWLDAISVKDVYKITEEEFKRISDNQFVL